MATTPTTPSTGSTTAAFLPSEITNLVDTMHSHTVNISYFFVAIIVLLIGLMTAGGYLAVQHFNKLEARAEAREAEYRKDLSTMQAQWTQDRAALQVSNNKVVDLEAKMAQRASQPLPKVIQEGLKSDASLQSIADALSLAYTGISGWTPPLLLPDNKSLSISDSDAKLILSSKVDLDKKTKDLEDLSQISSLQGSSITLLQKDLNTCESTVSEANKVIDNYKKLAVKSKFRKFLDGAEKVGLVLLGGVIGHAI